MSVLKTDELHVQHDVHVHQHELHTQHERATVPTGPAALGSYPYQVFPGSSKVRPLGKTVTI